MGRLINAFQTKIVFLTLVFLTSICSQILYETDDQQNTILNRRSKEVSAKSTLDETEAFLKKKTSSLQICIDNEDAYYDSLIFNSQRQTPSGKIYCFVFFHFFLLWMIGYINFIKICFINIKYLSEKGITNIHQQK